MTPSGLPKKKLRLLRKSKSRTVLQKQCLHMIGNKLFYPIIVFTIVLNAYSERIVNGTVVSSNGSGAYCMLFPLNVF